MISRLMVIGGCETIRCHVLMQSTSWIGCVTATLRGIDSHPVSRAETGVQGSDRNEARLLQHFTQKFRQEQNFVLLDQWMDPQNCFNRRQAIVDSTCKASSLQRFLLRKTRTIAAFSPGRTWTPGLQPRSPSQEESPPARIHIRL